MILSRDQILQVQDLESTEVEVPDWGGAVRVRMLTQQESDTFQQFCTDRVKGSGPTRRIDIRGMKVRLVILCCVDAEGKPLFTDKDAEALNAKSGRAIDVVFEAARKLNGIGEDQIKELTRDFQPAPD